MSKTPRQKPIPAKTETPPAPEQDIHLGDLTPEYIMWHEEYHAEEVHAMRYHNRIPSDYADLFGIRIV